MESHHVGDAVVVAILLKRLERDALRLERLLVAEVFRDDEPEEREHLVCDMPPLERAFGILRGGGLQHLVGAHGVFGGYEIPKGGAHALLERLVVAYVAAELLVEGLDVVRGGTVVLFDEEVYQRIDVLVRVHHEPARDEVVHVDEILRLVCRALRLKEERDDADAVEILKVWLDGVRDGLDARRLEEDVPVVPDGERRPQFAARLELIQRGLVELVRERMEAVAVHEHVRHFDEDVLRRFCLRVEGGACRAVGGRADHDSRKLLFDIFGEVVDEAQEEANVAAFLVYDGLAVRAEADDWIVVEESDVVEDRPIFTRHLLAVVLHDAAQVSEGYLLHFWIAHADGAARLARPRPDADALLVHREEFGMLVVEADWDVEAERVPLWIGRDAAHVALVERLHPAVLLSVDAAAEKPHLVVH